jgi:hypothetical protein
MAQKKLTAARLGQRELHAGVDRADVIEEQRRLWHLQDVVMARKRELHPERLVYGEVGDVHT